MDQKQNKNLLKAMWGVFPLSAETVLSKLQTEHWLFGSISEHLFISLSEEILLRVKRPKPFCLSSDGCFSPSLVF